MKIIKVNTKKLLTDFVKFPFDLYKNSKQWVPPIINEEINNFTYGVNPNLNDCDVTLFLAVEKNLIIGRVAAIINWYEVNTQKISKIRFGWFDTIDDIKVTKALINEVNKILEQINNQFSSLNEQVQSFRTLAEERGIELKQYKDGYNYSIVKSFIMGLIENIKYIDKNLLRDEIKNSDFARYLEASKDKLELLLVAQGVEKYIPEVGNLIMETEGCKAVGTISTSEDKKVNLIQSIITPGYKLQLNKNESNIIYHAEVIVFKKEEKNE